MMANAQPIYATARPFTPPRAGDWWCRRCGLFHPDGKPNSTGLCTDCRAVAAAGRNARNRARPTPSRVEGLSQPCLAWLRDFDDLDHPITPSGDLVAPGRRLCGHSDCIEPTHIEAPDE